jgi:hypothetical protein
MAGAAFCKGADEVGLAPPHLSEVFLCGGSHERLRNKSGCSTAATEVLWAAQ